MSRKYIIRIISLLLGIVQSGFGQERLSGRVVNGDNLQPVSGAVIRAAGTGTVSDSAGQFSLLIHRFPAQLEISHLGYEI